MNSFFTVSFPEKEEAIKTLLHMSRERKGFYFLLSIASLVVTLGLLTNNLGVLFGGALLAPLLFPVLSLALALATSSRLATDRALRILGRSALLIIIVALITTFFFNLFGEMSAVLLSTEPSVAVFLIAFASGLAVAYAWVRKEFSAALPGVAMSVSMLPPLTGIGAGLILLDLNVVGQALLLLIINALGILGAAVLVFSLFGFSRLQTEEEERISEQVVEHQIHLKAVQEANGNNE